MSYSPSVRRFLLWLGGIARGERPQTMVRILLFGTLFWAFLVIYLWAIGRGIAWFFVVMAILSPIVAIARSRQLSRKRA